MDPLEEFWVHTASVETLAGVSGYGQKTYSTPAGVTGFMDDTTKLVRNLDGAEVVSSSTFYCPSGNADILVPGSKVTYDGRVSEVIACATVDSGDLDLPDHVRASLT